MNESMTRHLPILGLVQKYPNRHLRISSINDPAWDHIIMDYNTIPLLLDKCFPTNG